MQRKSQGASSNLQGNQKEYTQTDPGEVKLMTDSNHLEIAALQSSSQGKMSGG